MALSGATRLLTALVAVTAIFVLPTAADARSKITIDLPHNVSSGVVAAATIKLPRSVGAIDGRVLVDPGSAELVGVAPLGAGTSISPVEVTGGYAFGAYGMTPRKGRVEVRLVFMPVVSGTLELRVIVDALGDRQGHRIAFGPAELLGAVKVDHHNNRLRAPAGTPRGGPARSAVATRDVFPDGRITVDDLDVVRPAWYRTRERDVSCSPGTDAAADANGDGCVDVVDLQAVTADLASVNPAAPTSGSAAGFTAPTPDRTFTVDSTADTADANLGNGVCADSLARCTLRAAIAEANRWPGDNRIAFNLTGTAPVTIQLGSTALPNVGNSSARLHIDGYSQPGSRANDAATGTNAVPGVEIRGVNNTVSRYILYLPQSGNSVRGLLLNTAYRGIFMDGPSAANNVIAGNWIGFNRDNSLQTPRGATGVMLNSGAHDNVIGTPDLADRNVVGNWDKAIYSSGTGTDRNIMQNNDVCMKPDGARAICQVGFDFDFGPKDALIGGTGPNERNVVGPTCCNAVELSHGWNQPGGGSSGSTDPRYLITGNRVVGNWLGFRNDGSYDPLYRSSQSVPTFDNGQAVNVYDGALNNIIDSNFMGSVYDGVAIGSTVSTGNIVRNNVIGESPLGQPAPMSGWGIYVRWDTRIHSLIGNRISNAATGGIGLIEFNVGRITMSRNIITNTNGPAIYLAPDPNNPAVGANDLLAPPTLSADTGAAFGTGLPGATVEVFRASRPAGQVGLPSAFLGSTTVSGAGTWSMPLSLTQGELLTALQTRTSDGTTSTLSANLAAGAPPAAPNAEFTFNQASGTMRIDFTDTSSGGPTSWSWDFGDGGTSTQQSPSHTYAAANDYTVTLTASNGGGASTATHTVTVTPLPTNLPLAADAFGRTSGTGWGNADTGGPYTLLGAASDYTVGGGAGTMRAPSAGSSRSATLIQPVGGDVDMLVRASVNKAPTGGTQYIYAFGRINGNSAYRPKLILYTNGTVAVHAGVMINGAESSLGTAVTVAGLTLPPGSSVWLRARLTGSSPTTIRVRAWADGQTEPSNWQFTATNSASQLQGPGGVGLAAALGSGTSNSPVIFSFDDYTVVNPNGSTPPPPPTADFTWSQTSGTLQVSFTDTSSGATDWAWDFGDGSTSTAQNPVHTYASAVGYIVGLTVTGPGGQSAKSQLVTVTAPSGGVTYARDTFSRTVSGGWDNADVGGPYTASGSTDALFVGSGVGSIALPRAGSSRGATLNSVSAADVDISFRVAADRRPAGGTVWVYAPARRVGNNEYRPKILLNSNGTIQVHAGVVLNDSESGLGNAATVSGLTYVANQFIWVRAQVTGANPTTIRVKAWADGTSEPTGWQYTATNSAAVLQGTGGVGLRTYTGSGTSNAPVTMSFDDYLVTDVAPPPPPPAGTATIVGAGDIADCGNTGDSDTAAVIAGISGTVFTAGDNVYPQGTTTAFNNCYEPSWGALKARTRPTPGNHDYEASTTAAPYFAYFGTNAGPAGLGYYAYDAGSWRIYGLNSECSTNSSCTAQLTWLTGDLAANPRQCSLAIWHRPRFSAGGHGSAADMGSLFQALFSNGVELLLSGHDHNYQRMRPVRPDGTVDAAAGVRQFVVGTGGAGLSPLGAPLSMTEVQNATSNGVMRLDLSATGYAWQFIPTGSGGFTDSGSATCH